MVAAELLKSKGVDSVQASCLEVLEDMLIRYMRELSRQSKLNAEVARRTNINPLDVLRALRVQGVQWQELEQYRRSAPDVDFAQGVSEFPVHKTLSRVQNFGEMGAAREVAGRHVSLATKIPEFFPAFPDVHSFVETEEYERGEKGVGAQMKAIVDQKEAIGEALVKLHERTKNDVGGDGEGKADGSARDVAKEAAGDGRVDEATEMEVDGAKDGAMDGHREVVDNNDENTNVQNKGNDDRAANNDEDQITDDKAKEKTTSNPFLMPVKWEDTRENATTDIVELLRVEKEARLKMERKRERDASVGNVGTGIPSSGDLAHPNVVNAPVEFSGFTWIEGGYEQRRTLAKSGSRAPGVYDSGQGEHIQDKVAVEQLLARNQGHEREAGDGVGADVEEIL
jgi:histone H3/H4